MLARFHTCSGGRWEPRGRQRTELKSSFLPFLSSAAAAKLNTVVYIYKMKGTRACQQTTDVNQFVGIRHGLVPLSSATYGFAVNASRAGLVGKKREETFNSRLFWASLRARVAAASNGSDLYSKSLPRPMLGNPGPPFAGGLMEKLRFSFGFLATTVSGERKPILSPENVPSRVRSVLPVMRQETIN